jgi:heme O synthase-like polyprenyltransferase
VGTPHGVNGDSQAAFYTLSPGGWRDYVNLLHPPYTLWHLSYVAIGGALAPHVDWAVLGLTVLAFFLGMGVGAHALDELHGRPLGTRISTGSLRTLAAGGIAVAAAIGAVVAVERSPWLFAFVAAGAFIAVAYNAELFGGRFHSDVWFGLAWGAFPVLTAYFALAERIRLDAVLAALFAFLLSLAQRVLSTEVRTLRRRTIVVAGTISYRDGRVEALDADRLIEPSERALLLLAGATVSLAAALLVLRLL